MSRTWLPLTAALLLTMLVLAGCVQPLAPMPSDGGSLDGTLPSQEVTLFVGPELVDCVGVAPMQCMLVKEDPNGEYQYFYSNIEGFDYEPGYEYELRVRVDSNPNPPADGSSLNYTLIEVVDKQPVATGGAAGTPTPSAEDDAAQLEGTVWEATAYRAADGTMAEPVPGAQPTARLEDSKIGGSTGCNNYFATYTLDGDQLSIGEVGSTMMACPGPLMDQEAAFTAALADVASFTLENDTLTLLDGGGESLVVFQPQQQLSLVDTNWQMTFYNNGRGGFTSALIDSEVTALFDTTGQVGGTAGCNGYGADYMIDGHTIQIFQPITTMMFCEDPEGLMEQEQAYLAALTMATTYDVQAGTLTLFGEDGARMVEFVAAPDEKQAAMADDPAAQLGNMTIPNEFGGEGSVQLEDGVYIGPPAVPGGASRPTVMLTNFVTSGELDGSESLVGIVVASGGGSGNFYELVVVQGAPDAPDVLATAQLGDRVEINSLTIEENQIVVDMVQQGPEDAMCCPSQNVIRTYALEDGALVQVSEEVIGEAASAAEPGAATEEAALEGTTWEATSMLDGSGNSVVPVPGAEPTISFADGQVSGTTGCNSYSGSYTSDGSSLSFGPLAMTAMACIGPAGDQEPVFTAALEQVDAYTLTDDGMLELLDADGNVVASFQPQEAISLTGTEWSAISYNNGREAVVTLLQDTEITAIFSDDGTISGSAGCNNYNAGYTVDGDALTIGAIATTRKLCPEEIMEQEQAYVAALEQAAVYQIDADRLQIRDEGGALLADYRPAAVVAAETAEGDDAGSDAAAPESDAAEAPAADEAASADDAAKTPLPNTSDGIVLDPGPLAQSYHWRIVPAAPYVSNVPTPGGLPDHVVITFDGQAPDDAIDNGGPFIYILPVAEYVATWEAAGNSGVGANVNALESLLRARSSTPAAPLPLLPPAPATNDLAVQTAYLSTDQFDGLRYVGRFAQDASPARNGQLNYYFQGLTGDGSLYVSLRWPVTTAALPPASEGVAAEQMDAVTQDYAGYIAETTASLNALPTGGWTPDLAALDALVESLTLTLPESAGTDAAATDADTGGAAAAGLVGPVWAWQRTQGGDDSVTEVEEPSRYTIEFMEDGAASLQADCNRAGATYTVDGSSLQIQMTLSTLALCPPDSLDSQFIQELESIRSFVIEDGLLYLSMFADAGILEFAPLP